MACAGKEFTGLSLLKILLAMIAAVPDLPAFDREQGETIFIQTCQLML